MSKTKNKRQSAAQPQASADGPRRKYPLELVLRSRIILLLADMLESELVDYSDKSLKAGYKIGYTMKQAWNRMKQGASQLREMSQNMDEEAQRGLGASSERMALFLYRIVLNCYGNPERYFKTYNALKAMYKPVLDLDLTQEEGALFEAFCEWQQAQVAEREQELQNAQI